MDKKPWETPILIAVQRGHSEEVVLLACKHHGVAGPQSAQSACVVWADTPFPALCGWCYGYTAS